MVNPLPSLFNSPTAREVVLRTIVLSSISSFVLNVIWGILFVLDGSGDGSVHLGLSVIPLLVMFHHILTGIWSWKRWSFRSDFIYSAVEFIAVTGFLVFNMWDGLYAEPMSVLVYGFFWLSVGASFVLTIWDVRVSQCGRMGHTYNFMRNDAMPNGRQKSGLSLLWSLLFGEHVFKRRFGMDGMFIRGLRAVIAFLCILAMIALGEFVLFVRPVILGDIYYQTLRTPLPKDNKTKNLTAQVTLVPELVGNVYEREEFSELLDFKNVSELFDLNVTWQPDSWDIPCGPAEIPYYNLPSVSCNVSSPLSLPSSSPDSLVITINYARALSQFPMSSLKTGVYLTFWTESSADMDPIYYIYSLPIQIYPGFHLFGTTFYSYENVYAGWKEIIIGIPWFNPRLVVNVQALIPDPESTFSNSDNATATLRLTYRGGSTATQQIYKVEQEQSSSTVLSGLALLGGVWTSINGLFAAVFGCTLLLVLCGVKPLSIYGLVHLFGGRRSRVVDGEYTLSVAAQNRTIAVMREHLLDDNGDMGARKIAQDEDENEEKSKLAEGVA